MSTLDGKMNSVIVQLIRKLPRSILVSPISYNFLDTKKTTTYTLAFVDLYSSEGVFICRSESTKVYGAAQVHFRHEVLDMYNLFLVLSAT